MKDILKVFRIITLVAVIGFSMTACGYDDGDNGSGGSGKNDGGGKNGGNKIDYTTNSIDDLATWLGKQPANAVSEPYTIKLQVNDLTDFNALKTTFKTAGKYVYLDFSGSPLTTIQDRAFSECVPLTGITISNSVTSIGGGNYDNSGAFYGCTNLASVTIPNSVTSIGQQAFSGCTKLASVTIPNNVTSIGYSAFQGCTSLASVTIPNSVTTINGGAFSGCTNLVSVIIPNSVTSIGNFAFSNCTSLVSVIIPNSVTSIGNSAFSDCTSLASITIGNGVTGIDFIYSITSLTTINVDTANTTYSSQDGILYNKDKTELLIYPRERKGTFTIPNSVTSIGNSAFSYCTSLAGVTIPNSVTSIENSAFSYCTSLASIIIPNSVTSIGQWAFSGCTSLTAINVDTANTTYSSQDGILYNKAKTEIVLVPLKITGAITIPSSVTSIENSAFSYCTSLASIIIPNSVTSIGQRAFSGCTNLTSITFKGTINNSLYRVFDGDLSNKYYEGGIGTYKTTAPVGNNSVWTKQ